MISVSLGPEVADAARAAVRETVAELNQTRARSDGLPFKAAHRLYEELNGMISTDEAWRAIQQVVPEMMTDGELVAPADPSDAWEIRTSDGNS